MAAWNDYKNHVRESNPEIGRDIDEVEERAKIVSAMIDQRHNLNLSQRDLAECAVFRTLLWQGSNLGNLLPT